MNQIILRFYRIPVQMVGVIKGGICTCTLDKEQGRSEAPLLVEHF